MQWFHIGVPGFIADTRTLLLCAPDGVHNSGTVYAQADSVRMSVGEIVAHEIFHSRAEKDPGLVKRLKQWILDNYSESVLNEKLERYYKSYQKAYSGRGTDEKLEEMILTEMLADAYAEYSRYGQEILPGLSERAQEEAWANEGAAAGETGTRFSISSTLETDLKRVLDGTFRTLNNEVYIGETSNFLTDVIGADALRVTMPPTKAYSAMVTKEQARADGRYDKDANYHGLGVDGLMKALEASENPVAAFADTGNEKGKRTGHIVLVTDEVGADGNIVVVEAVNAVGYLKGKKIEANKVITSYDRHTIANDILQAAIDGRLLHLDKKRSQTILAGVPVASPQIAMQESDFNKNIQDFWANVKWAEEGKARYLSESGGEEKTAFARAYEEAQRKRSGETTEDGMPAKSRFSIANTRSMPWEEQVHGYFKGDGSIKSSDSLYLGESNTDGIQNAPQYVPTSVITKAIRPPKGSRSAHALSRNDILNLENGIKNAPAVIYNPARNSLVYVTDNQDSSGNYIIATFDLNNSLHGENAHRATSIHGRENLVPMLEKLGGDATIYVRNENKFNQMLPGNQILKSLELLAKVELDNRSVAENGRSVKSRFSLAEHAKEQIFAEEEYRGDESPATGDIRFSIAENENITARSEKYFAAHRDQSGHISEEMFRAYLNIKNPYRVRLDLHAWWPSHTGMYLWRNRQGSGFEKGGA